MSFTPSMKLLLGLPLGLYPATSASIYQYNPFLKFSYNLKPASLHVSQKHQTWMSFQYIHSLSLHPRYFQREAQHFPKRRLQLCLLSLSQSHHLQTNNLVALTTVFYIFPFILPATGLTSHLQSSFTQPVFPCMLCCCTLKVLHLGSPWPPFHFNLSHLLKDVLFCSSWS